MAEEGLDSKTAVNYLLDFRKASKKEKVDERPLWQKAINKISRCLLGYNIFVIKKKIFN